MKITLLSNDEKIVHFLRNAINTYEKRKFFDIEVDVYTRLRDFITSGGHPDMVFVDDNVDMKPVVETARIIRNHDAKVSIVMVSSYSELVFDAFPMKTHRYLLKPVTQSEVFDAIDAYRKELVTYRAIIAKVEDTFRVFSSEELYAVIADGNKTCILLKDEYLEVGTNFVSIESQLPTEYFYKCHRSYIVNLTHLKSFDSDTIRMKNDYIIPISRRKKMDFFVHYSEFVKSHTFRD